MEFGIHHGNSRDVFQWQTGLPTNYRKANAFPPREWNPSLKLVVFIHCFAFAKIKSEPPKNHLKFFTRCDLNLREVLKGGCAWVGIKKQT